MKAYELLSDESKWIQGDFARTEAGEFVYSHNPKAAQWCVVGAVSKCYQSAISSFNNSDYTDAIGKVMKKLGFHIIPEVTSWNDNPSRKYEEVISILKEIDV